MATLSGSQSTRAVALAGRHGGSYKGEVRPARDHEGTPHHQAFRFEWDDEDDADAFVDELHEKGLPRPSANTCEFNRRGVLESILCFD